LIAERPANIVTDEVTQIRGHSVERKYDELATEEPMEIRVLTFTGGRWVKHQIAVTMRTPGNDFELASGFLLSEGVVRSRNDIASISYCTDPGESQAYNIVNVYLSEDIQFDFDRLSRNVYTSSSCGICGKGSIDLVRTNCSRLPVGSFEISRKMLVSMPQMLTKSQSIFARTGGLHACALFDLKGNLLGIKEDVGRHNALDKLVGSLLLSNRLPASNSVLLVSGRASFELVQKAAIAGIPFLAAVGAPSNLAVELAREYDMTLLGFLRGDRFNIYCGDKRLLASE
jgi:FdhD protein